MDASPRIGIYARISLDRDGEQTATARQLEDARTFVERKGWTIAEEFEDVDVSAYQLGVHRPEFERMLTALRNNELDGIVAWKLDRVSRQQRDLVRLMEALAVNKG